MFAGIAGSGILGGLIGYGLVMTTCADTPNRAERLLEQVPGFQADVASCAWPALGAALVGRGGQPRLDAGEKVAGRLQARLERLHAGRMIRDAAPRGVGGGFELLQADEASEVSVHG